MTDDTTNRRRRHRRGEGELLRAEILAAVNMLLDQWGSDEKLTMRAVAAQVGVSAPSIYLHFADKSELVWAALADKYGALADKMDEADAAATDRDERARLIAQVHAYCRFAMESPGHYRLMYGIRQPTLDYERLAQHPMGQVSARLRAALTACADAGYPLALPLYQAAHTLWTSLHGLISVQHTLAMSAPADLDAMAGGIIDVIVGSEPGPGSGYPPRTDIDRLIAKYVAQ